MLAAGVSAAFLTGDLFDLFVAIEMMLTASYVLMTLGGRLEQVRSGMTYVVISLMASVLFLLTLAFMYAATGTMNLADLVGRIAELPAGVRAALAGLLLVVFGIKAALFPLYFWLPDSYPTAPAAVTAIFAGLLTKVGLYAIIRTQTLLFPSDSRPATLLLVVAGLTMIVGILGAIAQEDIKRIFSFYIISQIGYIIMGLGLFTLAGIAGAVYAIVHHIVVKTTLFLVGGLIEHAGGTSRLNRLGNMMATAPVDRRVVPAAGAEPGRDPAVLRVRRQVRTLRRDRTVRRVGHPGRRCDGQPAHAVLDLQGLGQCLLEPAIGAAERDDAPAKSPRRLPRLMLAPTAVLAALTLAIGVGAGPLYDLSDRAAADLVDPNHYIEAVLTP